MPSRAVFLRILLISLTSLVLTGCTLFESKARSGLQIITGDISSIIFLDEQSFGTSPLIEKNLKPGTYTVRIEPTDASLMAYEMNITLRRSLLTVITWNPGVDLETSSGVIYEMERLKNNDDTEVVFRSEPDGAIVVVPGQPRAFTPAVFSQLPAGNLEYEVTLPSYDVHHHTLMVRPGYRMLVTAKLAKLAQPGEIDPVIEIDEAEQSATDSAVLSATTEETAAMVRVKRTGYMVDGKEVIRVRAEPSGSGVELKTIPVEKRYPYLGETIDDWHKIDADGTPGWISGDFAVLELPE